jgi:hypothetical protein
VVNDVPEPKDEPPVEAENQFKVPADAVAPKVTVPVPHRFPAVDESTVGTAVTVAVTATLEPDEHEPEFDST